MWCILRRCTWRCAFSIFFFAHRVQENLLSIECTFLRWFWRCVLCGNFFGHSVKGIFPQYHIRITNGDVPLWHVRMIYFYIVDIPACQQNLHETLYNSFCSTQNGLLFLEVIYSNREQEILKIKSLLILINKCICWNTDSRF